MRIVVLQHLDIEPPALIGTIIEAAGHEISLIQFDRSEELPDPEELDAAVIMGGPQSANDNSKYMLQELSWVKKLLTQGIPMLGICLGAQIMAKAAGAEIIRSPIRELGWYSIEPTTAGRNDPLFAAMDDSLTVFQWHGESFTLTDAMTLIASNSEVPAQAFRLGKGQYGLQFHVEVDRDIIEAWIAYGKSEREQLGSEGIAQLQRQTPEHLQTMQQFCRQMVVGWLSLLQPDGNG